MLHAVCHKVKAGSCFTHIHTLSPASVTICLYIPELWRWIVTRKHEAAVKPTFALWPPETNQFVLKFQKDKDVPLNVFLRWWFHRMGRRGTHQTHVQRMAVRPRCDVKHHTDILWETLIQSSANYYVCRVSTAGLHNTVKCSGNHWAWTFFPLLTASFPFHPDLDSFSASVTLHITFLAAPAASLCGGAAAEQRGR